MAITFKKGDVCCLRFKQKESDLLLIVTADSPVGTDIDGTVLWPTVVLHKDRQTTYTQVKDPVLGTRTECNYSGPYPDLKEGQVVLVPAGKMVVVDKARQRKI